MNATEQLFANVRDNLIQRLERAKAGEKIPIWERPWQTMFPKNMLTKQDYSGFNILALTMEAGARNYTSPWFVTYKQCAELSREYGMDIHVRKGEKSIAGVRWKDDWIPKDWQPIGGGKYQSQRHGDIKNERDVRRPMAKVFHVFNAEQIENCPKDFLVDDIEPQRHDVADFVQRTHAVIEHGNMACYDFARDVITTPFMHQYPNEDSYWATNMHELVHWTGHESRLGRPLTGNTGSSAYALEELTAEIGSAFLTAYFGLETGLRHAAYVDAYIGVLNGDLNNVKLAASKAVDAFRYLEDTIKESKKLAA